MTLLSKLRNIASFAAGRINIAGNVQSDEVVNFDARLVEINRANINDPLGPPDSGVSATSALFTVGEQMILSGWIRADDLISIDVTSTTGENTLLSYDDGPNSFAADIGSGFVTYNDSARIEVTATGSIKVATGVDSQGVGSSVTMSAGTGLSVLGGAVIAARQSNSSINLSAGTFLHVESGGALTAGAEFQEIDGVQTPVITGDNSSITLDSAGELRLSGSITSSGDLIFNSTGSLFDYADYFDLILGRKLAETVDFDSALLAALNNNTLPEALRMLFEDSNLNLGSSVTVTSVGNQDGFNELTDEQKDQVATYLGYTTYAVEDGGLIFYNSGAELENRLVYSFTEGRIPDYLNSTIDWGSVTAPAADTPFDGLTAEQKDQLLSVLGYTAYAGPVYYNPNAPADAVIMTRFVEGPTVDYSNDDIDWDTAGAPAAGTQFEDLTEAQQARVVEHLGYTYDIVGDFYYNNLVDFNNQVRHIPIAEGGFEKPFLEGVHADYQNELIYWGDAGAPEAGTPFAALSSAQKQRVAETLRYVLIDAAEVYYNPNASEDKQLVAELYTGPVPEFSIDAIDWGGVVAPADTAAYADLSAEQQAFVAQYLGYSEFTGTVYFNPDETGANRFVEVFVEVGLPE